LDDDRGVSRKDVTRSTNAAPPASLVGPSNDTGAFVEIVGNGSLLPHWFIFGKKIKKKAIVPLDNRDQLGWMWLAEELDDAVLQGLSSHASLKGNNQPHDTKEVERVIYIARAQRHVLGLDSIASRELVAKHKIDPVMEGHRHTVAFQQLTVLADKLYFLFFFLKKKN